MSTEELRTWLGLRLADLLVYLTLIPLVALYLIDQPAVEIGLAVTAVLLAFAACALGMKSSPQVSRAANVGKKIAYPFAVVFVLLAIGYHYVGYYQILQNGMYPGLPSGSRLLALRKPYRGSAGVSRGDIIVFDQLFKGNSYKFIWRVVGLPGDTVDITPDSLVVNGERLRGEESRKEGSLVIYREKNGKAVYEVAYDTQPPPAPLPNQTLTVPEGHFFVLGDNRDHAVDSRYVGPIPFEAIVGKKW
jgi:signal peptidase I